jgi:hypothetical protein
VRLGSSRSPRRAGAFAACASLVWATTAAAQSADSADTTHPSGLAQSLGTVDLELPDRGDPFDVRRAYNGLALGLGFFQARNPRTDYAQRGWELRIGRDIELRRFHLFLLGNSLSSFRAFDSKSFSVVGLQPDVTGGVYLGPLEVGAGAALTLLSIDDFDTHWSAQSLSPQAHADVAVRLGGLRFGAQIYAEEYWRWFGDDRRMRGFAFTISLDRPPTL